MAEKLLYVLGSRGHIDPVARVNIPETLRLMGENSGNLVFQYAVTQALDEPRYHVSGPFDPANMQDGSYLVFPAANHLRTGIDWTGLCSFLEKSPIPLIILGLGAQSPKLGGAAETIDELKKEPSVVRMANILRDKAALVTVRGEYTAQVANELGLKNISILGCPSLMINDKVDLGKQLAAKIKAVATLQKPKVALTAAAIWEIMQSPKQTLEQRLFAWTVALNGKYFQQSGGDEVWALAGRDFKHVSLSAAFSMRAILAPGMSLDDFFNFFRDNGRAHTSAKAWMNELSKFDVCFGTRLHGNMIAIAGGTPGIVIAHDSRTSELAESMHLPALTSEIVLAHERLSTAVAETAFNADAFDKSRIAKAQSYCELYQKLGLRPSASLKQLASGIAPVAVQPTAAQTNPAKSVPVAIATK